MPIIIPCQTFWSWDIFVETTPYTEISGLRLYLALEFGARYFTLLNFSVMSFFEVLLLRKKKVSTFWDHYRYQWVKYPIQVNLDMTDHCTTDFCIWRTVCLVPVLCISSIRHMYTTDFAYARPIFLGPLSLSYQSSPVYSEKPWSLILDTYLVKLLSHELLRSPALEECRLWRRRPRGHPGRGQVGGLLL